MITTGFTTTPNTTYDASTWEITSPVTLTSGVKWKGGKFTGTGAAFTSRGNCIGATVDSPQCADSINWLFDVNVKPFITYNGTDGSFLYKDLTVINPVLGPKTLLCNQNYEAPKTFHNVNYHMVVNGLIKNYDSNSENCLFASQSVYKFRATDWKLIGNTKTDLVDNGVVQLNSGNGQLKNIYRRGKQDGYLMRCWGVKLGADPDQDVRIENCVDAETIVYGTLDFRIDPMQLQSKAAIPLSGVDAYFINNTSANKQDINNGYVSSACVIGQTVDDFGKVFQVNIKSSVAFGAHVSAMANNSSLLKDNSSGKATILQLGNSDTPPGQPVPAGLVDANYYGLTSLGAQSQTVTPPVQQRSAVAVTINGNTATVTYDNGNISKFTIKNPIVIL